MVKLQKINGFYTWVEANKDVKEDKEEVAIKKRTAKNKKRTVKNKEVTYD